MTKPQKRKKTAKAAKTQKRNKNATKTQQKRNKNATKTQQNATKTQQKRNKNATKTQKTQKRKTRPSSRVSTLLLSLTPSTEIFKLALKKMCFPAFPFAKNVTLKITISSMNS
jgi:hypothetical protein